MSENMTDVWRLLFAPNQSSDALSGPSASWNYQPGELPHTHLTLTWPRPDSYQPPPPQWGRCWQHRTSWRVMTVMCSQRNHIRTLQSKDTTNQSGQVLFNGFMIQTFIPPIQLNPIQNNFLHMTESPHDTETTKEVMLGLRWSQKPLMWPDYRKRSHTWQLNAFTVFTSWWQKQRSPLCEETFCYHRHDRTDGWLDDTGSLSTATREEAQCLLLRKQIKVRGASKKQKGSRVLRVHGISFVANECRQNG